MSIEWTISHEWVCLHNDATLTAYRVTPPQMYAMDDYSVYAFLHEDDDQHHLAAKREDGVIPQRHGHKMLMQYPPELLLQKLSTPE